MEWDNCLPTALRANNDERERVLGPDHAMSHELQHFPLKRWSFLPLTPQFRCQNHPRKLYSILEVDFAYLLG